MHVAIFLRRGLCAAAVLFAATTARAELPLELIKLPEGFKIELYAQDLPNARSLAIGPKGTVFIGTRNKDVVYAVRDEDGDHKADKSYVVAKGLDTPNGVVFHNGALYVAEYPRLIRFDAIEDNLENPPAPVVVYEGFPEKQGHHWKYLALGPDEKFYVGIGAPGNIVPIEGVNDGYATISRLNLDGSNFEVYARGVRNSVGFDWHPVTKELWFTENGRDMMGDDVPPCELNHATEIGQHFGYPYCHGGTVLDPEFGEGRSCDEFVPPVQNLSPHVAPLGMKFYTGDMFPAEYKNAIIMAEHGSWNRSIPIGYRLSLVHLDEAGKSKGLEIFAEGWLQRTKAWGRPVDVLVMPDGALLVSDDEAGVLYRISYAK